MTTARRIAAVVFLGSTSLAAGSLMFIWLTNKTTGLGK